MLVAVFLASLALTVSLGPLPHLTQLADYPRPVQKDAGLPGRANEQAAYQNRSADPVAPESPTLKDDPAGNLSATANRDADDRKQERDRNESIRDATVANARASWLIAGFTLVLAVFSGLQILWLRRSVEAMQESNLVAVKALRHARVATIRSERPWVGADRLTLLGECQVGQSMEAEVILKNFGKAPARDFTTWGGSELRQTLGWPSMNPVDQYGPNVLFPTQRATYPHALREALSADQFRAIQNNELFFVVAGRLTYKDQRGKGCFTEYCGFYNTQTKGFQMVAGFNRSE